MSRNKNASRKSGKYFFSLLILFFIFLVLSILFFSIQEKRPVSKTKAPETNREKLAKIISEEKKTLPPLPDISEGITRPPRVAIILDDLGWNYDMAVSLLQMEARISFSILPNLKYSVKIAKEAQALHRDILLHLPMESHSNFEKYAPLAPLTITMTRDLIETKVEAYLNAIPYIKGVNNHMGSSFTENEEGMKVVLNILRKRGLFFVDSLTTPKSVAYNIAKQSGVKTARRSVFLDNDNRPEEIKKRFAELKRIAVKSGAAIGIGHLRANTILVLEIMVVKLAEAGVQIVPVSQLVR